MEAQFHLRLRYEHSIPVPVDVLGRALLGAHHATQIVPKVLQALYPGLNVQKIALSATNISQNSPLEGGFIGRVYYDVQQSIEGLVLRIGRATGVEVMEENKKGISLLIMALLLIGASYGYYHIFGSSNDAINGDYNTVINIASPELGVDPDTITRIISLTLVHRDKDQLARDAFAVFAPSRVGPPSPVVINDSLVISSKSVAAVQSPEILDQSDPDEFSETFTKIDLYIRATDLDKTKTGWAGLIEVNGKQRRVRMVIVPGIDLVALQERSGRGPVKADLEVFFKRSKQGGWEPYVMHLYHVHDEKSGF